jgi:MFS transporter, FHS family, L-fucose permease
MPMTGVPLSRARTSTGQGSGELVPRQALIPFVLVTALFFLWGIPHNLNDVLIRQFMKSFAITRFQAGLVQSAFYFGYFVLAVPAALVMRRFGYKRGLIVGLSLYAAGCFLFWPAAVAQRYSLFLMALFIIASGLAFLETGANSFVAQLGDPTSSERRLTLSQAFNPLGSVTGVLIGTTWIFSGVELTEAQVSNMQSAGTYQAYLSQETMRVVVPYLILGCLVIFWAVLIGRTKFPVLTGDSETDLNEDKGNVGELLRTPRFLLAVLAQFVYVGAQVGTWSYYIQYIQDYVHGSEKTAGYLLTGTLAAFAVGRFSATVLMRYISPHILMGCYSLINIGLVAVAIMATNWTGVIAIFVTSFFMSLMFPTIFALGLKGLGANTKVGGSIIVMAIIGGAVFTPLIGFVAGETGSMAKAMFVPLLAYVYVAYFAFFGSQLKGSANTVTAHA